MTSKSISEEPIVNSYSCIMTCLIEVGVGEDRELLLDGLKESNSNIKPIVSSMALFRCVSHGSKWASSLGLNVIGSS